MKNYIYTLLFATSILFSCETNSQDNVAQATITTKTEVTNIPISHLDADGFESIIQKGITVLDVRTLQEYNQGHIENAIHIDWYQRSFRNYVVQLHKDKPIAIYCRSGNRTSKTVSVMQALGFKEIYNLERGIVDWISKNKPLTQADSEANKAFQQKITDVKTEEVESSIGKIYNVSAQDLNTVAYHEDVTLVDIRTTQEFNAGHIEGAINIDWYKRDFRDKVLQLSKEKAIAIYCRSGNRTSKAANVLQSLGFKQVINLTYGINDWNRQALPLIK